MEKIVVTTGQPFTDIDSLACAIAYTELLISEGKDAETVLPGSLNKSITQKIKNWNLSFSKKLKSKNAKYILVDISDPQFFANFVKEKNVIEVFDHRSGFENYWKEKIGTSAKIEMVGSCATLIWEEFKKRKRAKHISDINANLLYTAIISNTLNFKASVTTSRDKKAFNETQKYINLPKNWIEIYFEDQEKESLRNPRNAILNDTKGMGFEFKIGQLEFWDSKKFVFDHLKDIEEILSSFGNKKWFFTSPSINEGINYLFTKNPEVKSLLEKTIRAKFDGDIGITDKLWLRKEIMKEIQ
jgi:inorganic pyrophosphatase/exopolyphosphatase